MILTGPFHLDVFCDHTMALDAHQGHFPSPKHLLQEAHVQFILIASLDTWTFVDLDALFETVPGMCASLSTKHSSPLPSEQPLPALKHSLMCAQT